MYDEGSKRGEDKTVYYHGVLVGVGAPNDGVVRRGRQTNKFNKYLYGKGISYCGTSTRSSMHLECIEYSRYGYLDELISGRIEDEFTGIHQVKEVERFVDRFVNHELVSVPNSVPNVDVLNTNIQRRFGMNTGPLKRYMVACYVDEINARKTRDMIVPALNASQRYYICQVLVRGEHFDHYAALRRRMSAFIGPPGTGKQNPSCIPSPILIYW